MDLLYFWFKDGVLMINSSEVTTTDMSESFKKSFSSVLIIGGGIAGIQAALDLANQKIHVFLIEKAPAIGGAMAKLDKTLPTNDCAVCIEAPKMVELGRNKYIDLITCAEISNLKGRKGNFQVTIDVHPRYIDSDKCTGCGDCFDICPVRIPNEFDHKMGTRGAIHRFFAQAVPNVAIIDKEHCINCGLCEIVCVPQAIVRNDKKQSRELKVGAIILATGFEEYNPSERSALGYGIYSNVVTGMEFERMLSASGPTDGKVQRPSDEKVPEKIAWIQCVGSRDAQIGKINCSRVCCMWATKQAMISKDHHPDVKPYIFYMDMRAYGKGFEEYYRRAKEKEGINYIKSRPAEVLEEKNKNLIIFYEDIITRRPSQLEADLVVLSSAMIASSSNKRLSQILGVELDEYGFFQEEDSLSHPLETNVEGIFHCGCCSGPKDIPDSVAEASGAASLALATILNPHSPNEKEIAHEFSEDLVPELLQQVEPRIGVFLCHCGHNIAGYLDIKSVTEHARTLPGVEYAVDNLFTCSESTQELIKNSIMTNKLNRIVVASCSPRTHESLFKATCREAGMNEYLFEMANIRDQCSWVHSFDSKHATQKAKALVSMAVAKAKLLEPANTKLLKVIPECLVIGGGVSGLTASWVLSNMGYKVHLVEKEPNLGGFLKDLTYLFPTGISAETVISEKLQGISENENVQIYLSTHIKDIKGSIGEFTITLDENGREGEIKVGTIIVATGAEEFKPLGYFNYDKNKNIMTMSEFEKALKAKKLPKKLNNVIIINCVGSREENGRTYCCRIGCEVGLKNANIICQNYPTARVFILHRDLRLTSKHAEKYYRDVRQNPRIHFVPLEGNGTPVIDTSGDGLTIAFRNLLTGEMDSRESDLIILTTPLVASTETKTLSQLLKVPVGIGGFFQEAHVKLRPLDFATDGIYVCGTAHSPKNIGDSVAQALGAAARASIPMRLEHVTAEPTLASIDPALCVGCGTCGIVCPFGAISFTPIDMISHVNEALCKGCGVCAVTCPAKAIKMRGFTNQQIIEQISEALKSPFPDGGPKIIGFCCNWCSYAGADLAGISRHQYPPNLRIIRVMCSGRVDPFFILWAFLEGADGVFVSGCHPGDCHYLSGNLRAQEQIERMKEVLSAIGIDRNRLTLEWVSASEGKRFAEVVTEFTNIIRNLGPIELLPAIEEGIGVEILVAETTKVGN